MGDALRQQSDLMPAQTGGPRRWSPFLVRQAWPGVLAATLLLWMGIVAVRGTLLVVQSFRLPLIGEPDQSFTWNQLLAAAVLIVLFCMVTAMTARRFRPVATLPVTCCAGGLVLLAAAVGSGSLGPLLLVLAMFAVAWVLGYGVLSRLPAAPAHPMVSVPVAIALGLGVLGLLLFLLAYPGWLGVRAVMALAVTA